MNKERNDIKWNTSKKVRNTMEEERYEAGEAGDGKMGERRKDKKKKQGKIRV